MNNLAAACMVLSGPILTGYTQTLNDWEDRCFTFPICSSSVYDLATQVVLKMSVDTMICIRTIDHMNTLLSRQSGL